jgi:hypothetical protein
VNQTEGIVTIVQEGRFQLSDDAGISHLFILSYAASGEPEQLEALQQRQARVRVRYRSARNMIAGIADAIDLLGPNLSEEARR